MERLSPASVLASAKTQRVLSTIVTHPGITITELSRRCDMYWSSTAFHVQRLERVGLVRTLRIGRRRAIYSSAVLDRGPSVVPAILGEPSCRRVAHSIALHPGCRVLEVVAWTGMSERAVYHHVKHLLDAGLVLPRRAHARGGLEASPALVRLLADDDDDEAP